jgi:hypothetical protein
MDRANGSLLFFFSFQDRALSGCNGVLVVFLGYFGEATGFADQGGRRNRDRKPLLVAMDFIDTKGKGRLCQEV